MKKYNHSQSQNVTGKTYYYPLTILGRIIIKNKLTIIHQNIHRIKNKAEEIEISFTDTASQIIYLSEHHLRLGKTDVNFNQYLIGKSCRQMHSYGGVCILIHNNFQVDAINVDQFKKENDLETWALKIHFGQKMLSLFVYIGLLLFKIFGFNIK
jgi:hypothetical protein